MSAETLASFHIVSLAVGPLASAALSHLALVVPQELLATLLAGSAQHGSRMLHVLLSFGLVGFFLVSIIDSSFVPLPIPGISDLMILFFAAQHTNVPLLITVATAGSALGGYLSFQVGQKGGMQFLEHHVPERIFKRVCRWMEQHAVLIAAWAGVYYGRQVLQLWGRFSDRWATTILIVFWTLLLSFVGVAFWRLYHTSKTVRGSGKPRAAVA